LCRLMRAAGLAFVLMPVFGAICACSCEHPVEKKFWVACLSVTGVTHMHLHFMT
jgi:hypothetical protein